MAKVLGVGGIFFRSTDQKATIEWKQPSAATVFSSFLANTTDFEPWKGDMVNLMVDDLEGVLARCAQHGVKPLKVMNDEPNGRFAHIVDLDGRKIELWEPTPMAV